MKNNRLQQLPQLQLRLQRMALPIPLPISTPKTLPHFPLIPHRRLGQEEDEEEEEEEEEEEKEEEVIIPSIVKNP